MRSTSRTLTLQALAACACFLSSCATTRQSGPEFATTARPVEVPTESSHRQTPQRSLAATESSLDETTESVESHAETLAPEAIEPVAFKTDLLVQREATTDVDGLLPTPTLASESADATATSQTIPSATVQPFSLSDAETAAVSHHPGLGGAAAAINKATGLWQQVGLKPNPIFGYQGNEIGVDGSAGQQGLFWQQTFVRGDKLRLSREVEAWNVEQGKWQAEAMRRRILTDVRTQFYTTLAAQKKRSVASELIAAAAKGVSVAEELVEAGEVPAADVLQARVQAAEIAILGDNAEADAIAEWRKLSVLTGWSSASPTLLAGELDTTNTVHDFESIYNDLLSRSPEIHAAETAVHAARKQIERQQHQATPNLNVQAGIAFDDSSNDAIANLQFAMPFPVHNDNRGNVTAAWASHQRACADLQRLKLSLRSRLADAYRSYDRAARQVRRYQDDILPAAAKSLELSLEGYQAGQYSILRSVQARQSYSQSQLNAIDSQAAHRIAEAQLQGLLLTGSLSAIPDTGGDNLQGVGLRDQALGGI